MAVATSCRMNTSSTASAFLIMPTIRVFTTGDKSSAAQRQQRSPPQCEGMHGLEYSITMKIPAMSAVFLKPVNKRSPESDKPSPKGGKPKNRREKGKHRLENGAENRRKARASTENRGKKANTANRRKTAS
ncbi:MAG: hypothetical protein ACLS48_13530 [[Eubacterium] siraeum]